MAEGPSQLPRYTSTPLAGRKTSNFPNDYFEVSPIFSTPEDVKNTKSQIPVLKGGQKRPGSNGIQSIEAKKKLSSTSNRTGAGSSGPITVLPPTQKSDAVKKLSMVQAPSQSPKKKQQRNVLPEENPQNGVAEGAVQTKPSRVSKVLQRPSTLPSVPEEVSVGGNGQLPGDCIFKKSEVQSGWMIPKESKTRVSLKRKSSVPQTITKKSKVRKNMDSYATAEQDDESLFESPEIPNLVEVSSLKKERRTYVVKNKPETTKIDEVCQRSVIDGIIPLEILSQKSSSVNTSGENTKENSRVKSKESISNNLVKEKKDIAEQNLTPNVKVPQNKRKKELGVSGDTESSNEKGSSVKLISSAVNTSGESTKENSRGKSKKTIPKNLVKEIVEQNLTPNFKVPQNKRKFAQKESSISGHTESSNEKESPEKLVTKDQKQIRENEELANVAEGNTRVLEVDAKKKESKRKYTKAISKESNPSKEVNNIPLKNTVISRKLRERKPNVQYTDSIKSPKEKTKNKKESTVKTNKTDKENLKETQADIKTQRKKTVKENVSEHDKIPTSLEADLQNDGQKNTEDTSSTKQDLNLENKVDKRKTNKPVQPKKQNAKKMKSENSDNKTKEKTIIKLNSETLVETEETPTSNTTGTTTKTLSQKKKQNSLGVDHVNNVIAPFQRSKHDITLPDDEYTNPVLQGTSSSKSISNNKTKSDLPETKIQQQSSKTHSFTDKIKPIEDTKVNGQHNKEDKKNEQNVEEKKRPRRKTTSSKRDSKIQSGLNPENNASKSVGLNRLDNRESCLETNNFASTSGQKRKSEEMDCGTSHSDTAVKRCKHDDSMRKVSNAERGFIIKELFGNHELNTHEVQPGVIAAPSVHIHGFVKMGEVRLEPGACLSKISTHTAYIVMKGTAQVTIKKHTQLFNANDEHRRFFIPKSIDVSITNPGNETLRMDFVKFRG